jgi:hypothetical protein
MTGPILVRAAVCGALGSLLGGAYCIALAANIRLYLKRAQWRALPFHLLRIAGVAAIFMIFARQGAMPLLVSLAGFLAARTVAANRQAAIGGQR